MDILKLKKALNHIRLNVGEVPVQQLVIFFEVAYQDGEIAQVDLIKRLGMPQGTVSRNVARLSNKTVKNELGKEMPIGYGLIEPRLDGFGRRENLFLTPKGQKLLKSLENLLD